MSNKCASDLDIDCRGPDTVCQSKWSQLPTGGLGFSVNINKDKAYCGPFGKCIGKIIMNVEVHRLEEKAPPPPPKVTVASPAPASPASPAAAPAVPTAPPVPPPPVWLECGLPVKASADIDNKEDWKLCQVEVKGDTASCKMSLFKELEAGGSKESYCVLTDAKDGKRLTSPYWSAIMNVHEEVSKKEVEKAPAKEKKEPEKEPKKEKKEPEKKVEKPKKEEKEVADLEHDDSGKLPWMVDKERRQAEREAEDAKAAEEAKEAAEEKAAAAKTKKAKADEEKAKEVVKAVDQGEEKPPWMKGKENPKPAPPAVLP